MDDGHAPISKYQASTGGNEPGRNEAIGGVELTLLPIVGHTVKEYDVRKRVRKIQSTQFGNTTIW